MKNVTVLRLFASNVAYTWRWLEEDYVFWESTSKIDWGCPCMPHAVLPSQSLDLHHEETCPSISPIRKHTLTTPRSWLRKAQMHGVIPLLPVDLPAPQCATCQSQSQSQRMLCQQFQTNEAACSYLKFESSDAFNQLMMCLDRFVSSWGPQKCIQAQNYNENKKSRESNKLNKSNPKALKVAFTSAGLRS